MGVKRRTSRGAGVAEQEAFCNRCETKFYTTVYTLNYGRIRSFTIVVTFVLGCCPIPWPKKGREKEEIVSIFSHMVDSKFAYFC